ncbi:alpha/beta fold hydrolase [Litoreibacter arenae]|uniref:Hydrolase, alpha/beta fold family n=1 Tax=Litoreibacter arenae DSM 19593 TaxID=1123360 RepID=S9RRN4_9RHOB|nr:alpha/beta hydrolase [Litoreibacter arenae]EPX80695.1 Hydrolase, alpha/beta fold family [Litoreibacter arenae DSM 19593]
MPDALLLHGMLADRRVWRSVIAEFPDLDCATMDLPGHGAAVDWDGGDYQTQAFRMAEAAFDAPLHLIGHSYGATVALRLAVERPELLRSLTLVEPVFFYAAKQAAPELFADYATRAVPVLDAIAAGDNMRAAELFLADWGVKGGWAKMPEDARDAIAARMPLIAVTADGLEKDTGRIWPRLPDVTCPVLIVTGGKSDPVMPEIVRGLENRFENCTSVQIDDAGHMIPVTHGPQLAAHIAGFMA